VSSLPEGSRLVLDRSVRSFREGTVLVGGHPGRLITLTGPGASALSRLTGEAPTTESERRLGLRLVSAGLAHPVRRRAAPGTNTVGRITVVVPVRDRSESLDRCLASLGPRHPVVVVDDASLDPAAIATVCARHGAHLIVRTVNGGPGAARNDALAEVTTELVALVDSDCTVEPSWLEETVWLFDDPAIGAVAPRVSPQPRAGSRSGSTLDRYLDAHSPLDMGASPGEVGPDRAVRYLPTAALVLRREALAQGFDANLRVGEDVDLVWRLVDAGWRVRYEPAATVWHTEPSSWPQALGRRLRYGTSAGPLSRRHPGRLAPFEVRPWPLAVLAAVVIRRPALSATLWVASAVAMERSLGGHGIPRGLIARWSVESIGWTWVGVGRAATMLASPALVALGLRSRRAALVGMALVVVPPLAEWRRRRPALDPIRFTVASVADDMAYGAGVWIGSVRARSPGALLPRLRPRRSA
jgi:mycofactocin system glycosyltransferase